MKCNLELPCSLCIRTRREHLCRECPPDPPSEQERLVQQERRSRNSRRKDKLKAEPSKPDLADHRDSNSPSLDDGLAALALQVYGNPLPLFNTLQRSPPWILINHLPLLLLLLPPDQLLPFLPPAPEAPLPFGPPLPEQNAQRNIHRLRPMLRYTARCRAQQVQILETAFLRWSALQLLAPSLAVAFKWAHLVENPGFHELIDWPAVYAAAQKMLEPPFRSTDKHTLQCMVLAAAIIACGCLAGPRVSKRAVSRSEDWLALLDLLAAGLDQKSWEDGLFLIVHVMLTKSTLMALAQFDRLSADTRRVFAAIAQNALFVRMVHQHDYQMLPPEKAEKFAVLARCWTYVKLVETEVLVLQAETLFQFEHPQLNDTIQPDRALIKWLYDIDPDVPLHGCLIYDIGLIASSLFFRRFENCKTPRDISHAYLTLYSEFCSSAFLAAQALFVAADDRELVLAVKAHKNLLAAMLKVSFICVRWLLIIRAEPNKFVTLRFAHYVTTLILMFNMLFAINDAGLPETLYEALQSRAQLNTVLDLYNMLSLQALFVAVMKNFTRQSTFHWGLDLQYLVATIRASYTRARLLLGSFQPHASLPVAVGLLEASEALMNVRYNDDETAMGFFDHLANSMDKATWKTFVLSVFGLELTGRGYVEQLWRFGHATCWHAEKPMMITKTLVLDTAFLRQFERSYRGFWFSRQHVEEYLEL